MQADRKRAAIYCRVADKDDRAIEHQRQTMRRFAAKQGYEDCAEYLENGAVGTTLDRPVLNRLTDAMANDEVQVVFVHSTDRIARGFMLAYSWLNFAESLGVEVISPHEDIEYCLNSFTALLEAYKKRK